MTNILWPLMMVPALWQIMMMMLLIYILMELLVLWAVIKYPETEISNTSPSTAFSILIPFKDEAENLPFLLQSLKKLNYPEALFEIILIDDQSADNWAEIIEKHDFVRVIANKNTGKKQALLTGVKVARYEWIVTTDADCKVPENWLRYLDAAIQKRKPKMLLGPVAYTDDGRFITRFQQYEFLSLQALSMAGVFWQHPFLSNGAHLAFEKKAFFAVNAYEGNIEIASGDDVFLLEKFQKKYPGKIGFIKNTKALVLTAPQPDWSSLVQQKIRWAGKSKFYQSNWPKLIGIITILANIGIWISLLTFHCFTCAKMYIIIKLLSDTILVYTMCKIYRTKFSGSTWLGVFLLYPLYVMYIFFRSLSSGYEWKGRKYRL